MIRHGLTIAAWNPSLFGRLHTCIGYRNYKKCARDAPGRVWIIRSVMRDVIREATEVPGYRAKYLSALSILGLLHVPANLAGNLTV
jgi:hypothetical protein